MPQLPGNHDVVDPAGKVRFAYHGTYCVNRPSIKQTLDTICAARFDFEHSQAAGHHTRDVRWKLWMVGPA